jgi:hypothetical protein
MATESPFGSLAHEIASGLLVAPLRVVRGEPLLYELTVDNNIEVMNPAQVRRPKRGASVFQTDLCILEKRSDKLSGFFDRQTDCSRVRA